MAQRFRPLIFIVAGILLGVTATLLLRSRSAPSAALAPAAAKKAEQTEGEQVVLYQISDVAEGAIETVPIRNGTVNETLLVNGRVVPDADRIAKVSPLVSGRASRLLARVGQRVRAGQMLAIIESADAARAYAAHEQARSQFSLAQEELQNTRRLAAAGMFTQKPVDEVRRERALVASELATMRVNHEYELAAAESEAKSAQAALSRAQSTRDLSRSELARRSTLVQVGAVQYKPLEEAKKESAEARASLITAEANLAASESQARRTARLLALGTATQRELESARAAHSEAKASVERTQARVEIAQQALGREQRIFDQKIYASRETESAETELNRAERDVQEKQASLEQARRRFELARSPQKKAALQEMETRLAALDAMLHRETSVSQQNLLAKRAIHEKAAAVAQARLELQAARNAVRLFKIRATGAGSVGIPVTAPIDGIVSERPVQIGQSVDPTTVLFTVLDSSAVWVELDLYENDLSRIRLGQPIRLFSAEIPRLNRVARIVDIGATVDPQSRVARVRAVVAGNDSLKPGMFVKAEITVGSGKQGLIVPREAIADEPTGNAVYIKWPKDQGWERHPVEVVAMDSRFASIKGPAAGEQVATRGLSLVQAAVKTQMAGGAGKAVAHTHEH